MKAYTVMFCVYLGFVIFSYLTAHQVNQDTIPASLEVNVAQIRNDTLTIKHYPIRFNVPSKL